MGKIGGILITLVGVGILMIGFRPAWDVMYDMMNTTGSGLSGLESTVWRLAPIAIPVAAIIGGIVIIVRRDGNRREGISRWEE